jgi:hypothetical protein
VRVDLLLLAAFCIPLLFPCSERSGGEAWCAVISLDDQFYDCAYFNWAQCDQTVRGVGGYCQRNPWYQGRGSRRHSSR